MIKVDIISGFLGAGKTTLIKKLLKEAFEGEKVVLIENEFGEVGIDGNLFEDTSINVTEINSGCICCSLTGDFTAAFENIADKFAPDRILVEPSGVGKLSDIAAAVQSLDNDEIVINSMATVVDAKKCRMYLKNFGEFFENQIEYAGNVILSHTGGLSDKKLKESLELVKGINAEAVVITTPWDKLDGKQILEAMELRDTLDKQLEELKHEVHHHHHDHDEHEHCHHDHDEHEHCHHDHDEHEHCHHDHDEHEHCHHDHDEHEHCHHDHDEHEHCHHDHDEHEHCHHDHDEHEHHHHDHECSCGCGHDHDHDADEIFDSWGKETAEKYSKDDLKAILESFEDEKSYGMIIRAKGIVESKDGGFLHFEYIPGEIEISEGGAAIIGRICVIGAGINSENIQKRFEEVK